MWFIIDLTFYSIVCIQLYSWFRKPGNRNELATAIYVDDAINFHKAALRHYSDMKRGSTEQRGSTGLIPMSPATENPPVKAENLPVKSSQLEQVDQEQDRP